jgi:hemolysin activation/secretion protein
MYQCSSLLRSIVLGLLSFALQREAEAACGPIVPLQDPAARHAFASIAPGHDGIAVCGVATYVPQDLLSFATAHDLAASGAPTVTGLLDAIEQVYREDGYLLAEATSIVDPASGEMAIIVHEGHIERMEVVGLTDETARQVESYFAPLIGQKPLHSADFERALMLGSDLSGVDLRSEFQFASDGEGATLRLSGAQLRRAGSFSVDNVPLPDDDAVRALLVEEFYSVATGGDMVRMLGVATHEWNDSYSLAGTLFYRRPVGDGGAYVEAYAGNAFAQRDYTEVSTDADQLGINAAMAFGYALRRDLHGYTYVLGEYEYQDAESRLRTGDVDSVAHAARVHLIRGSSGSDGGQRLFSLALSLGGRPNRAADEPVDGDRNFVDARAALGWIGPLESLSDRTFLRAEVHGQWTGDSLPQVEKFTVGHWPHLRGYVPVEVLGDRGYAGTVEISHVFDREGRLHRSVAPFIFLDIGAVRDVEPTPGNDSDASLASTGVGMVAALHRSFSASAWIAVPLEDGTVTEAGDVGFYLSLTKGWGR